MRALKGLTALAIVAVLVWGGLWFAGARALDRALAEGLARQDAVSVSSYRVLGFPNRFDITLSDPVVTLDGLTWQSPFLQFFALTYRPHHLLAVFAPDQRLIAPGLDLSLNAGDLRASVVMEASLDLPLDRTSLVGEDLTLLANDLRHAVQVLRLATRRLDARVHQAVAIAEGVTLDASLLDRLDPGRHGPRVLTELRLDAEVTLDRPMDRHLVTGASPQVQTLALTGARLAWDGTALALTGRLVADAQGLLSGDMTLQIEGWAALTARARAAGVLDERAPGFFAPLFDALEAEVQGDSLTVPMAVTQGDVHIGPLSLGGLPALR